MSETAWRRTWAAVGIVGFAGIFLWVLDQTNWDIVTVLQYAVAGLGPGAAAAIVGVGLALTYQTTGIFNFAFGSMATFAAYIFWQLVVPWGLPVWAATIVTVLLAGPMLGLLSERLVFRGLQRRGASTSENLLATIALFSVFLGLSVVIWGLGTKLNTPTLFGPKAYSFAGNRFVVTKSTIGQVLLITVIALGVTALLRYTRLGREIRAVVDRRSLAELSGIRANRVAAIAWGLGGGFAALAGVLYAPGHGLNPYDLTLLILETFAVVVVARLTNMRLAIIGGLGIGVLQSLLNRVQPQIIDAWQGLQNVQPYLFIVFLPLFLVIWRRIDELGGGGSAGEGIVAATLGTKRRRRWLVAPGIVLLALAVAAAYGVGPDTLSTMQQIVALSIIFLSIVAITGFSGHITLGQAAFAGLGALITVKAANGVFPWMPQMNGIFAMLFAAGIVTVVGLAIGFPAMNRRGLILGLMTLGLNLVVYFFILQNFYFIRETGSVGRPSLFGLSLTDDKRFYFYELGILLIALAITARLRSGQLGRVLGAMRDSETAAMAVGINLRRYKLFIFAASAFMASIGGSLYAQQQQTFDQNFWSPLTSLFWFLAVVFAGLSYLSGAILGAMLSVGLDSIAKHQQASAIIIGVLTLITIGFLRGGLVGWVSTMARGGGFARRVQERMERDLLITPEDAEEASVNGESDLHPSGYAEQLLEEAR